MRAKKLSLLVVGSLLSACSAPPPAPPAPKAASKPLPASPPVVHAPAYVPGNAGFYKEQLARHIYQNNPSRIFVGQPHALLRAVLVMRFVVDGQGNLVKTDFVRTNHDKEAEMSALASLRGAAPFPRPAPNLLAHDRMEITETWLFQRDGRFQLRTIAEPQQRGDL